MIFLSIVSFFVQSFYYLLLENQGGYPANVFHLRERFDTPWLTWTVPWSSLDQLLGVKLFMRSFTGSGPKIVTAHTTSELNVNCTCSFRSSLGNLIYLIAESKSSIKWLHIGTWKVHLWNYFFIEGKKHQAFSSV